MGRSKTKPVPKRPRLDADDDEQAKAIALLQSLPQEQVEEAAAEATRSDVDQNWPHLLIAVKEEKDEKESAAKNNNDDTRDTKKDLEDSHPQYKHIIASVPSWAQGLGSSRTIDDRHFRALQALYNAIKAQSPQWTSWSGSPMDPRQRAFGFLPGTLGYDETVRRQLDISMPWRATAESEDAAVVQEEEEGEDAERSRNGRAIVVLETLSEGVQEAVEYVCGLFRDGLVQADTIDKNDQRGDQNKEEQQPSYSLSNFLHYRHLIAAQPNLHNGRALLPVHLDHPCKDGFGVVIITIAMTSGQARILLNDVTNMRGLAMPLRQQQAYLLSGMARDACVHGVLADVGSEHRESLNLRFGLHDLDVTGLAKQQSKEATSDVTTMSLPVISSSQVLKYWEAMD